MYVLRSVFTLLICVCALFDGVFSVVISKTASEIESFSKYLERTQDDLTIFKKRSSFSTSMPAHRYKRSDSAVNEHGDYLIFVKSDITQKKYDELYSYLHDQLCSDSDVQSVVEKFRLFPDRLVLAGFRIIHVPEDVANTIFESNAEKYFEEMTENILISPMKAVKEVVKKEKTNDEECVVEDASNDKIDNAEVQCQAQFNAKVHLNRLSSGSSLSTDQVYSYPSNQGADVLVYVFDTGIYTEHPELEGRVSESFDFTGQGTGDKNGHGTHVAGIIASKTYGVAKKVTLSDYKVLFDDGSGLLSNFMMAFEHLLASWTLANKPTAVINMSVGSSFSRMFNREVRELYKEGLHVVVAAGNENSDACSYSPSSVSEVLVVGSMDGDIDQRSTFSNFGSCVDIYAIGNDVVSLSHLHDGTGVFRGTSQSAPVVAGIAALLLGVESTLSPAEVKARILETSITPPCKSALGERGLGRIAQVPCEHQAQIETSFDGSDDNNSAHQFLPPIRIIVFALLLSILYM